MNKPLIMIGRQFGRWKVVGSGVKAKGGMLWRVQCACGNKGMVRGDCLRSGHSRSCGCLPKRRSLTPWKRHGQCGSPEHEAWRSIKQRCLNSRNRSFHNYGGRGITVCERWRDSFEAFLADVGPRPSTVHSIDRINNNGNYEPGNCRWATKSQQAFNRRKRPLNELLEGRKG